MAIEPVLTRKEAIRLTQLETQIRQAWLQAAAALREIRDTRLYRESYETFEEYCQEVWDMSRRYVNYQIRAEEVVAELGTNVPKPKTEAQARELARVADPEKRAQIWTKLTDGYIDTKSGEPYQPPAVEIRQAVDRVVHPNTPPRRQPQPRVLTPAQETFIYCQQDIDNVELVLDVARTRSW